MADQLATPQDLASLLQLDYDSLTDGQKATMALLVELGTGKVQRAAGGQRIVDITDTAVIDILDLEQWLELPQRPIRSVSAVNLDGTDITDWKLVNQKLFRLVGWLTSWEEPSQAKVTYTHGYPTGSQYLQIGRSHTLSLAVNGWDNITGASSEGIDDYKVSYAAADAAMQLTQFQKDEIAAAYGSQAYTTRSR